MSESLTPEQRANKVAIDYATGLSRTALARDIAAAIRAAVESARKEQQEADAKIAEAAYVWHGDEVNGKAIAAAIRSPSGPQDKEN